MRRRCDAAGTASGRACASRMPPSRPEAPEGRRDARSRSNYARGFLQGAAGEVQPHLVEIDAGLVRARHPNHDRRAVGHGPEAQLAFAQLRFGAIALRLARLEQARRGLDRTAELTRLSQAQRGNWKRLAAAQRQRRFDQRLDRLFDAASDQRGQRHAGEQQRRSDRGDNIERATQGAPPAARSGCRSRPSSPKWPIG